MAACIQLLLSVLLGALGLAGLLAGHWARSHFRAGAAVDTHDCYFDKECHDLVDWNKVTELKMGFFKRLKHMKEKGNVKNVKPMLQHMHQGFLQSGMPEDRIDYILTKWVQYVYPEALDVSDTSQTIEVSGFYCENGYGKDLNGGYVYQGTTKDGRAYYKGLTRPDRFLYYDKYCADDTREPRWLLGGAPDVAREFDLNPKDGKGCDNDFAIQTDSMHLPGGLQQATWQWCGDHGYHAGKSVSITYKIDGQEKASKKGVDTKDCYFDKECHAKVDWGKIRKMKAGFFARLKILKKMKAVDKKDLKPMMGRMHQGFLDAGMPEDRIDYILTKWAKFVLSEGPDEQRKEKKDGCYMRFGNDKEKCEATSGRCHWYADKSGGGKCAMPVKDGCFMRFGNDKAKCEATSGRCHWYADKSGGGKCAINQKKEWKDGCFMRFGNDKEKCEATRGKCHWYADKSGGGKCAMPQKKEWKDPCFMRFGNDKEKCEATSGKCHWYADETGSGKCAMPQKKEWKDGCFMRFGNDKEKCEATRGKCHWYADETGSGKCAMPQKKEEDECKAYEKWGENAIRGCRGCAKAYPGHVKECFACGKMCSNICPKGSDFECYRGEKFQSCHAPCMKKAMTDTKDCYFDKECHAKVDWNKVAKMKEGFFARLKWMKENGVTLKEKPLMKQAHQGLLKAGMPEDRIDYILEKWAKLVFPEGLSNQPMKKPAEEATEQAFDKYWKELTLEERKAAELAGYTQNSWDNEIKVPVDLLWWSEVPDAQRKALMTLGYTKETWNQDDDVLV